MQRRLKRRSKGKGPRWWYVHNMGCVRCNDCRIDQALTVAAFYRRQPHIWPHMPAWQRAAIYCIDWDEAKFDGLSDTEKFRIAVDEWRASRSEK